jgi:hypothetical protein
MSQAEMNNNKTIAQRIVFGEEANFHTRGRVNCHYLYVLGTENDMTLEHQMDSQKLNIYCATLQSQICAQFLFAENTVSGINYLDVLQNWLMPQLREHGNTFIFQEDGVPSHFHQCVHESLNVMLPIC